MNIFTCNNLIAMGRHIPTPFYIAALDESNEEMLKIEKILRIVPGKRIVALSKWKGQTVVTKLFFRRGHWKQSMLRDLKGVTLLRQAGIPTPKIVYQTTTVDKHGAVLFIDYLKQGVNLKTLYEDANSEEEQLAIVEMGVEAIAHCHQAGLWQQDIHLGNFMLSAGKIYALDGGDIKGNSNILDRVTCVRNLALFFAQFAVVMDVHVQRLLQHYQKYTDILPEADTTVLVGELNKAVVVARQRRLRNFERKLFRSTTTHRQVHTFNRFAVYDRTIHCEFVENFIRDPDSLLAKATMLKEGNSSTVVMIQFGGRDFVLKRYNIKSFLHGLKRLFQPSRAHKSWRNAAVLEMLGVSTPHPFLMIEERLLWLLRRRAWYLSEYINAENLLVRVQKDSEGRLPMKNILVKFKQLFQVFQTYNISHGDMKASNFIYKDKCLHVLDLDAMRRHSSATGAREPLQKDKERFQENWEGTRFESAVKQLLGELEQVSAN